MASANVGEDRGGWSILEEHTDLQLIFPEWTQTPWFRRDCFCNYNSIMAEIKDLECKI